jgi:DNA repair photolyase
MPFWETWLKSITMIQAPQINEVIIKRILNPTAIDLGEYVINPFMGCEFSCLYCYARSNRVISRKKEPWGEYVDVRINAPEALEKELLTKKPKVVLLGLTTECFQPVERKYEITKKVLEILNNHKVHYVILTRSPYIVNYISLLRQGFCRKIYFTINKFPQEFKQKLEPSSPSFDLRDQAVNELLEEGVSVVPYFSPVLPWISDFGDVFLKFNKAQSVEFECLNFRLNNIEEIINRISEVDYSLSAKYRKMLIDRMCYDSAWQDIRRRIQEKSKNSKKNFDIYIHSFGNYFENKYTKIF